MMNTVKEHREDIGFSQERLAQTLGVSRNTVVNCLLHRVPNLIEKGEYLLALMLVDVV